MAKLLVEEFHACTACDDGDSDEEDLLVAPRRRGGCSHGACGPQCSSVDEPDSHLEPEDFPALPVSAVVPKRLEHQATAAASKARWSLRSSKQDKSVKVIDLDDEGEPPPPTLDEDEVVPKKRAADTMVEPEVETELDKA